MDNTPRLHARNGMQQTWDLGTAEERAALQNARGELARRVVADPDMPETERRELAERLLHTGDLT